MNLLNSSTHDLGETATYSRREVVWFPFDDNGFGGLIIRQWFRTTQRGKARLNQESDLYQVVEVEPDPGVMGRCFALHNVNDKQQELPYRTTIGPQPYCTCKAGRCHAPSDKHVEALQLLADLGVLDGLDADEPAERYEDEPGIPTREELDRRAEELGWLRRREMVA